MPHPELLAPVIKFYPIVVSTNPEGAQVRVQASKTDHAVRVGKIACSRPAVNHNAKYL